MTFACLCVCVSVCTFAGKKSDKSGPQSPTTGTQGQGAGNGPTQDQKTPTGLSLSYVVCGVEDKLSQLVSTTCVDVCLCVCVCVCVCVWLALHTRPCHALSCTMILHDCAVLAVRSVHECTTHCTAAYYLVVCECVVCLTGSFPPIARREGEGHSILPHMCVCGLLRASAQKTDQPIQARDTGGYVLCLMHAHTLCMAASAHAREVAQNA